MSVVPSLLVPPPPLINSDAILTSLVASRPKITKSTVTQLTSTTTAVTINASAGVVTTISSTLAADATETFVVNNSYCGADSVILVNHLSYTGTDSTAVITVNVVDIGSDVFSIQVGNGSGAVLDGSLTIGFLIV